MQLGRFCNAQVKAKKEICSSNHLSDSAGNRILRMAYMFLVAVQLS